jgi:hypothetical protein
MVFVCALLSLNLGHEIDIPAAFCIASIYILPRFPAMSTSSHDESMIVSKA